jgi:hypothetical protein
MRAAVFAILLFVLVALPSVAQQSFALQQLGRDPKALAIAQHALSAMGYTSIALGRNTVVHGKVTYVRPDLSKDGTVTFKTGGAGQFRTEINLDGTTRSAVYNGGMGAESDSAGTATSLRREDTLNKSSDHLPGLTLLAEYSDPAVNVHLVEQLGVGATSTWKIEFERSLSLDQDPLGNLAPLGKREIFVDQATLLVVMIRYEVPTLENLADRRTVELQYSDYRPESGLMLPHKIVESVAGTPIAVYQTISFDMNATLDSSEFQLPAVQR